MHNTAVEVLKILTDVAPLVLSTIILGGILLFGLWAAVKIVIPAMGELIQMSESQRKSWLAIVEEQKRINTLLVAEIQVDLTAEKLERKKLEVKVEELSTELARKDVRIAELQVEINNLTRVVADKDILVENLRTELNEERAAREKIEQEKNDLSVRIEILEKASKPINSVGD